MDYLIEIEIKQLNGEYEAHIKEAPVEHRAVADDPLNAIRGALAVSQGAIDDQVGYDRDSDA